MPHMKEDRTISITTGTILKTLLILVGAWLLYFLHDLVLIVLAAVVIASAMEPAVRVFRKWGVPRILAVILIYLLLFSFLFSLFYFFVPTVLEDVVSFVSALPSYIETINRMGSFTQYTTVLGFPSPAELSPGELLSYVRDNFQLSFLGNGLSTATSVFGGVFSFILILVFSFYFTVMDTGVDDFLRFIAPLKYQKYLLDLWFRSKHKIGLWMQGQLLLGVIMGVLVYLGLTILGIKHALLLAVLAACFELIPLFGPVLAAVPAVLLGFVDGGFTTGVFVIALYVILQQFENHLIYPLVVTKVVGVPPLLVILGLIIGAKLAGFLGILLSVPIVAAFQELFKDINARRVFVDDERNR